MRTFIWKSLVLATALTVAAGNMAFGQVAGAILSGTVIDASEAVIPNATVTIRNVSTGVAVQAYSNGTGVYTASNLLPGDYQVNVVAAGFAPQQRTGLTLTVGERQVLNVQLRVSDAATTAFDVGTDPFSVELGSPSVSSVVTGGLARDLPMDGRDWTQLATLEPGVNAILNQPDPNGVNNRGNRGFGTQVTIAGARPYQNSYRLDGIAVNDYANSTPGSTIGLTLGTESLHEFSVISNNYAASYGQTSGGVVNAQTRSGTNDFHGSLFEFLRNDILDARGAFDGSKLPFRRNQFGASAGGPIIRQKLFFFVNYEGLRQALSTSVIDTVPSVNARSGLLTASTVKVDPSVQKYLGLFALPNGAVQGDTGLYSFASKALTPENYFTGRMDYSPTAKDTVHGTYLLDRGTTTQPDSLNVVTNKNKVDRQMGTLEETHIFSRAFVNTVRIGVNREVAGTLQTAPGANPLGNDGSLGIASGLYAPVIQVSGLTAFQGGLNGTSYGTFAFTTPQVYDDAFVTTGKHSFKFGFEVERIDSNLFLANNPDGLFKFNSLGAFLQNKPNTFQFQLGAATPRGLRQNIYGGYAEDDMHLLPNLTVNVGVRYEMSTVPTEVNGELANLRYQGSTTIYTGGPLFQNPTKHNFEPRVGLAWDPFKSGKTSVRAGFGIFDVLPLTYQFNTMVTNAAPYQEVASSSSLPTGSFPTGAVALVTQASAFRDSYIQFNPPRNYVMQWNTSIQREAVRHLILMLGYVGTRGIDNAMRVGDANMVVPFATPNGYQWPCAGNIVNGICSKTSTSPKFFPGFGQVDGQVWNGHSYYNAMLVSAQRHLEGQGLDLQASFTWSKSIDTNSSVGTGAPFSNSITGQFLYNPIRALSDFNIGKTFVFSGTWQVPLYKTRWFGGWQLSSIFTVSGGEPFTPAISGDALGQANQNSFDVPNRLNNAGCGTPVNPGNPNQYIKLSCFAFANPSTLFGDAGRNEAIGPGVINADLSLFKNIPLNFREGGRLQIRLETFNLPNRANFGAPITNSKLFDTSGNPVPFAGQITTLQTPGRVIQIGLKLLW